MASFCPRTRSISFCVLFLLPLIASSQPLPEYSRQAEDLFTEGLGLYKKGDFKSAAEVFAKLSRDPAVNQRTTAAYIMKAKAELYGGNTTEAEKTLKTFLSSYPTSTYVADAQYTSGLLYLKRQEYEKAVSTLLDALQINARSTSGLKREDILSLLDETIDGYVSLGSLQHRVLQANTPAEEEYLDVKIGEKQTAKGDYAGAKSTLDNLQKKFSEPTFSKRIAELEGMLQKPRPLKLGVLLPLMRKSGGGREKEIGNSLLSGIEFALAEHLGNSGIQISLEIRDTEHDLVRTAGAAKELADDQSVIAILGPAFSDEAFAAGSVANDNRTPIVTPTATANGITARGDYLFQANPDFETRAKAMAWHAVKNLQLKHIAVLSSEEQTSKSLADVFVAETKRLGVNVVDTETYEEGSSDITEQLAALRRKSIALANEPFITFNNKITAKELGKLSGLGVAKNILDSLQSEQRIVNAADLLGEKAKSMLQSNAIPFTLGDPRLDSLGRIMTAIDGVYCPIGSSSEIGVISSQLMFAGFTTTILGNGEWNNISELNTSRRSSGGVQFESDSYLDPRNPVYADFVNRFSRQSTKVPAKNTVYGYDAAKLVLSLIEQGALNREQLKDALSRVVSYESLHSKISFSPRRTNSWLNILEYSNDGIHRITEVNVE